MTPASSMRSLLDLILTPNTIESTPDSAEPIISDDKKMYHCRSCGHSEPYDTCDSKTINKNDYYMITYYCSACGYEEEVHPSNLRMIESKLLEYKEPTKEDLQKYLTKKIYMYASNWPQKGQMERYVNSEVTIASAFQKLTKIDCPPFKITLKHYASKGSNQMTILYQFIMFLWNNQTVDLSATNKCIVILAWNQKNLEFHLNRYYGKYINEPVKETKKTKVSLWSILRY